MANNVIDITDKLQNDVIHRSHIQRKLDSLLKAHCEEIPLYEEGLYSLDEFANLFENRAYSILAAIWRLQKFKK